MPGPPIQMPKLPGWADPAERSVFDYPGQGLLRTVVGLLGLDDPNQVMGVGAAVEAGPMSGGVLEAVAERLPRFAKAVRAYKGGPSSDYRTGKPITEFKSRGVPQAGLYEDYVGKKGGFAGFFSDSPEVASRFTGPKGAVHPVDIDAFTKPLTIDAKGSHAANFQFADRAKLPHEKAGLMEMWDTMRGKNVGEYDGIILKNTADEGTVYVPLHPDRVRSAFASQPSQADIDTAAALRAGLVK